MLSALFKRLVNASAKLSAGRRRRLTLRGTATSSAALVPRSHAEPRCTPLSVGPRAKVCSEPTQGNSWGCRRQASTLTGGEKITEHWFCSLVAHEHIVSWTLSSCVTKGQTPNLSGPLVSSSIDWKC